MVLPVGKLTKLVVFQAGLKVEKGWVVMFGAELVLLQLTKALIFKLR